MDVKDIKRFIEDNLLQQVSKQLKEYGFRYITLDMEGYRTGSLNEVLGG